MMTLPEWGFLSRRYWKSISRAIFFSPGDFSVVLYYVITQLGRESIKLTAEKESTSEPARETAMRPYFPRM